MRRKTFGICYFLLVCVSLSGCALSNQWSENFALAGYGTQANDPALSDGKLETIAYIHPQKGERVFMLTFPEASPMKTERTIAPGRVIRPFWLSSREAIQLMKGPQHVHTPSGDQPNSSPPDDHPPDVLSAARETTIQSLKVSHKKTLKGHSQPITAVTFSPDGRLLASVAWDEPIKIWSVGERLQIATLHGQIGVVRSVAFSPNGQVLASASYMGRQHGGIVNLWSLKKKQATATLKGHHWIVTSVAFSPDGITGKRVMGWRHQALVGYPRGRN